MDEQKLVFVNKVLEETQTDEVVVHDPSNLTEHTEGETAKPATEEGAEGDEDVTHVSADKEYHILRTRTRHRVDGSPCDFGKIVNRETGNSSGEQSIGFLLAHADGHMWKQVKDFE